MVAPLTWFDRLTTNGRGLAHERDLSVRQIQGRTVARQMKYTAEVGISAATFPHSSVALVWSASPD